MTFGSSRLVAVAQRGFQTRVGRHFSRFALVAVVALGTSEATVVICLGPLHRTTGFSGLAGWFTGAAVSYLLSRWAWERKGRPHLLKETLPFWAISIGTAVVLTSATHFAGTLAKNFNLHGAERVVFVAAGYLIANALTFLLRFLIFHYVLFSERWSKPRYVPAHAFVPRPAKRQPPAAYPPAARAPAARRPAGYPPADYRSGARRPAAYPPAEYPNGARGPAEHPLPGYRSGARRPAAYPPTDKPPADRPPAARRSARYPSPDYPSAARRSAIRDGNGSEPFVVRGSGAPANGSAARPAGATDRSPGGRAPSRDGRRPDEGAWPEPGTRR